MMDRQPDFFRWLTCTRSSVLFQRIKHHVTSFLSLYSLPNLLTLRVYISFTAHDDSQWSSGTMTKQKLDVERMVEHDKSPKCCEQCGNSFKSKKHGGGSPQRFCSRECRMAWHSAQRKPACTPETATAGPELPDLPKKAVEDTPEPNSGFEGPTGISIFIDDSGLGIAILRKRQRHDLETINIAAKNVRELVDRLFDIASVPSASE